ncbi:polysaccharide biosynthesis tyrosine autokinase [Microbacterium sp.]|uniref:polysaccharide biosynthesis tyrosine autokinase n=1 Tax=Microbacterium sp. TaxID=51671 RepID=UPI002811E584|nr:polysaccharide biosynthesis tyrosine autokinase [Microbacterium sp.]
MDLRDFVRVLRRQVVVVIAALVIGVSCGAILALTTPQRYEASTQLMVAVETATSSPIELTQGNSYAQQVVESYRSIVTSTVVLEPVIEDLGLDLTPDQLAAKVNATVAQRSVIITITVGDANPGQAARLANAIGESFTTVITEQLEKRETAPAYRIRIVPVQPAQVPTEPAAPNLQLSLALGAILGLGAGIGLALLRTLLDTRIHNLNDVETAVQAPILGGIAFDPDAAERPLIVATHPHDPRAEAFRSLRTNVRFLFPPHDIGVFVVTSARPSEGKSTTASNLAIALAESGYRVALVDADLRKPRLAHTFAIEGAVGLSDVLVGRVGLPDVMQRWGQGMLFLLPAGTPPPNPAELLGSTAMKTLIDDLKAAFDVVVIDAPPILPVTDAAVVARYATGVVLVAAAGSTRAGDLTDAASRIEAADSRVLGTVVTMLPIRGADKTAYGTYGYGALART